jgi:hypothetical protein
MEDEICVFVYCRQRQESHIPFPAERRQNLAYAGDVHFSFLHSTRNKLYTLYTEATQVAPATALGRSMPRLTKNKENAAPAPRNVVVGGAGKAKKVAAAPVKEKKKSPARKAAVKGKKAKKDPNAPKRPTTSYFYFGKHS